MGLMTSSSSSSSSPTPSSSSLMRTKGRMSITRSTLSLLSSFQQPSHSAVLESIDEVFPPNLLDQRIALSRKDGYWPFISEGEDPPQEFVYGEFDIEFFCNVLERARQLHPNQADDSPLTFCDLGSGTGRLVLVAAALYPWKLVRGIELLPGIHEQAVEKLESCRRNGSSSSRSSSTSSTSGSSSSTTTTTAATSPAPRQPSSSSIGGGSTEPAAASNSELDDYWKQYKQFTVPKSPSDDWLNELSDSLIGDDDDEGDSDDVSLTDGGLYLPDTTNTNTNTNQQAQFGLNVPPEDKLSYSTMNDDDNDSTEYFLGSNHQLPLAPIQLSCGSFDDPYEFFGDADVIFCFSSAMPHHILVDLARAVGRQCKPGTIVLTTEYRLPEGGTITDDVGNGDPSLPHDGEYALELVEELNGTNEATGGESTVFVHRLTQSLVPDGQEPQPLSRPRPNFPIK
ncbi:unnamed protein product [Cylindrotheca closterium]|uniref:Histone-lysine N-methyltransferase, H3 lysine-79 specific n=1 Tax=Cylindrotheca closterium TaxID=2856 RepID=A0AAD2GAZ9_9STRA|nr:unnamed protein product [Cylindrotheca closterium]